MVCALLYRSCSEDGGGFVTLTRMTDTNSPILFQISGNIATLRVNRPEARNALNWEAQELFARHVAQLATAGNVRALIITGTGDAFVSGGDLKELASEDSAAAGERLNRIMSNALLQLMELPFPVIAAVNGHAVGGGCEILTACDLRLAREGIFLKHAQVQLGLTTGWGGASRLIRLLGQSRAAYLLLTGRRLSAREAQEMGLVHEVVSGDEDVLERALEWARQLAAYPPQAVAAMKQLLVTLPRLSVEDQLTHERDLFLKLWGSADHLEALSAFMEKRRLRFGQQSADG